MPDLRGKGHPHLLSYQALPVPETKDRFSIQIYPQLVGYMASETLDPWKVFFHEEKWENGLYLKKPFVPDFKTYIFGIVLQFPIDWLKRNFWNFFFLDWTGLQDPCVGHCRQTHGGWHILVFLLIDGAKTSLHREGTAQCQSMSGRQKLREAEKFGLRRKFVRSALLHGI